MRKTVQTVIFCLVAIGFGTAQNAETIFDAAAKAYEKSNGISVSFVMNIQSERQGVSESVDGTLQMKGDKFVLFTSDTQTWYNGKTQWTYVVPTDEVYLTTPSGDDLQFINPMTLFLTYKQGFNLLYIGESTSFNGKTAYDLLLTSKGKSDVERIEMQIDKASSLPLRMNVYMNDEVRNIIRINNMQTGLNQPDSFFTFNPADYPNVIEVDLR